MGTIIEYISSAPSTDAKRESTSESTCVERGFHGPFLIDRSSDVSREFATCATCGDRVRTAEHLTAYQIARFHGLVR